MAAPRVYVSHSPADRAYCRSFVTQLRALGYDVWYDDDEAASVPDDLAVFDPGGRELAGRQHVIVLWSAAAAQSPWVRDEIAAAVARDRQGTLSTLLAVIVAPCDLPPALANHERVAGPDGVPLSVAAAVARVAQVISLARDGASALPLAGRDTPRPATKATLLDLAPVATSAHRDRASGAPAMSRRALLGLGLAVAAVGGGIYWFTRGGPDVNGTTASRAPTATPPPAAPATFVPDQSLVPPSLSALGFLGRAYGDTSVIIPPTARVPAGPFLMGSDPARDPLAQADERPQSAITIAAAYQIGRYHVTVAEYALAVRAGAARQPPDSAGQYGVTWRAQLARLDHPVVNVSWFDVIAYTVWLARVTATAWWLPTEAEWEKAARGTAGRVYPWGDQWDATRANTDEGGQGTTTPVGAYAAAGDASPFGAHDMAGNVWQWCSTIYQPYPYNADDGRENLSDRAAARALRGGSWFDDAQHARAAYRLNYTPAFLFSNWGFRLARADAGAP